MAPPSVTISLLDTAKTNQAATVELSADELLNMLAPVEGYAAHHDAIDYRTEKMGPCWSPITWAEDERSAADAESVSALSIDLDWDEAPERYDGLFEALDRLGWRYGVHETFTAGRSRLVLPFASPFTEREGLTEDSYARLVDAAKAALGGIAIDEKARDLARVSFLPSCPPGETRDCMQGGTVWLDWRELLKTQANVSREKPKSNPAPIPENSSPEQKPIDIAAIRSEVSRISGGTYRKRLMELLSFTLHLKKGERENELHRLVNAFVSMTEAGKDWYVTETLFRAAVERMEDVEDEGVEFYVDKVHSSWLRALEHRERKDAIFVASRKFFDEKKAGVRETQPVPSVDKEDDFDPDWEELLQVSRDEEGDVESYRGNSSNIDIILRYHHDFRGHIHYNELLRRMEISGGALAGFEGSYDVALMQWLERSAYRISVKQSVCGATLLHHSRRFRYNPVADYLNGLEWDGTQRLHSVLADYCNAVGNNKYLEVVSRKFFIACAARALEPGCKVDTVLVLQGTQGIKKTMFVETLARGFYTTSTGSVADKDMRVQTTESWLVELGEMATLSKQSIETLRGFLTQRADRIRIPYATYHEEFPRRCAFIGTTNAAQPLVDEEGNRRWWVVTCEGVDVARLEADVDQLWAEATHYFRKFQEERDAGVPEAQQQYRWWLTSEEQEISNEENEMFVVENTVLLDIQAWMRKQEGEKKSTPPMPLNDIARKVLRISNEQLHRDSSLLPRIGRALTVLGWKRKQRSFGTGRGYVYEMPTEPVDEVIDDALTT